MEKPKITSYVKMPRSTSEVGSVDYEAYSYALEQYIAFLRNKKRVYGEHRPAEMFDAMDWLGEHRDIYHHPRVSDRLDIKDYDVAELMADFANWYYENKKERTPAMIKPEEDLELSIKALRVYPIEPAIIKNMLYNLRKIVGKK